MSGAGWSPRMPSHAYPPHASFLYWKIADLQCGVSFRYGANWLSYIYILLFRLFFIIGYSVQFSHSVVSDSLQPHGLQHTRPPCPSQLLEFTQTHVHWDGDAIQPSHPLSSPSPPAFNLSQHQGLFQWVSSSHQVAKVLEFQLQHQSFQDTKYSFPCYTVGPRCLAILYIVVCIC